MPMTSGPIMSIRGRWPRATLGDCLDGERLERHVDDVDPRVDRGEHRGMIGRRVGDERVDGGEWRDHRERNLPELGPVCEHDAAAGGGDRRPLYAPVVEVVLRQTLCSVAAGFADERNVAIPLWQRLLRRPAYAAEPA